MLTLQEAPPGVAEIKEEGRGEEEHEEKDGKQVGRRDGMDER